MTLAIRSNPSSKRSSCEASSFLAMSDPPCTRPAQTARRAAGEPGMPDPLEVGLVSTRNPYRQPGGLPWLTVTGSGNRREWRPRRALWEESQFARNQQDRNQGKDHPMQDARPIMRQEDPTQASPARSAIAQRTLSTPHARATSCRRYTGIPTR